MCSACTIGSPDATKCQRKGKSSRSQGSAREKARKAKNAEKLLAKELKDGRT